ncbi:MAG: hypothetical protein ACRD2U_00110 [Terriglobales bacterium]
MKTVKRSLLMVAVLLATTALLAVASPQRYLHVRVNGIDSHELVRINLPLSLAEKIIPAINHGKLHNGKVEFRGFNRDNDSVNLKEILDALKSAPEGEFVTVQEVDSDVRVAKEHEQLVVHVVDKKGKNSKENVDVRIPWAVALALTMAQTSRLSLPLPWYQWR